jgi:hypothetical protein
MHPSAETKAPKQIEHSQSLVPGFISRDEQGGFGLLSVLVNYEANFRCFEIVAIYHSSS